MGPKPAGDSDNCVAATKEESVMLIKEGGHRPRETKRRAERAECESERKFQMTACSPAVRGYRVSFYHAGFGPRSVSCAPEACCLGSLWCSSSLGDQTFRAPADRAYVLGPEASQKWLASHGSVAAVAWCSTSLLRLATFTSLPGQHGDDGVGRVVANTTSWS